MNVNEYKESVNGNKKEQIAEQELIDANTVKEQAEKTQEHATLNKVGWKNFFFVALNLRFIQTNFSYVLFLTFFILLYIANGHKSVSMARKINKLMKQNKELRYEYLNYKNELTHITQQNELMGKMAVLGFKLLKTKPEILIDSTTNF